MGRTAGDDCGHSGVGSGQRSLSDLVKVPAFTWRASPGGQTSRQNRPPHYFIGAEVAPVDNLRANFGFP